MNYKEFLERKKLVIHATGFDSDKRNPKLFDWQSDIVKWLLKIGRGGQFSDCGTGKTATELEYAKQVSAYTNKPVLILCPLCVAAQTRREGVKFDVDVNVCRSQKDVVPGVNIANYEMIEHFNASKFGGVILDESSILKAYMGKTKRMLVDMFKDTPFKLVASATPSPNDQMELLNQAEYLGIMRSSEALSIWFIADQQQSGTYRLKGHAEADFWEWVSTWAVCFERPSDIGYSDDNFCMPDLIEKDIIVDVDVFNDDLSSGMFRDIQTSATGFYAEKRMTLNARVKKCAEIATSSDEQCVIWVNTNDEADAIVQAIPGVDEVRGNDTAERKEKAALDFIDGKTKILCSKPSMFGYGLNLQNCHKVIFCGLDYSYENYYQAVRRFYRFGQTQPVTVYRVLGETEKNILDTIERKSKQKQRMGEQMKIASSRPLHDREHYALNFHPHNITPPTWLRSEA